ncbi:MAG: hypothetical protein QM783_03790 [Phycisphaerales bacterium]
MLETDPSTSTSTRARGDQGQDVFLSPRVIDREAFNDYSASLRRLIEEAAHQTEALKAAAAEAAQAQTALRETSARHQGRADSVTKALAVIDQRLADADRLAKSAEQTRQGIQTLSNETQTTLATRTDELTARLNAAAESATEMVRRAEHGSTEAVMNLVSSAERKLTQVEARLIEFKPRTEPAPAPTPPPAPAPSIDTSRIQQLLTMLAAERERAEARVSQLRAMCDQAERSRTLLTEAIVEATEQANAATGSAREVTAKTEVVVTRLARVINALPG